MTDIQTNIVVPLPLPVHIAFCVIGMLYFGFRYYSKNHLYYLLLAIAIPSTLLIYISNEKWYFYALAAEEFILAVMIAVNMVKVDRMKKAEEKALEQHPEEAEAPPADRPGNDDIIEEILEETKKDEDSPD